MDRLNRDHRNKQRKRSNRTSIGLGIYLQGERGAKVKFVDHKLVLSHCFSMNLYQKIAFFVQSCLI